jgi:hypothetical protein
MNGIFQIPFPKYICIFMLERLDYVGMHYKCYFIFKMIVENAIFLLTLLCFYKQQLVEQYLHSAISYHAKLVHYTQIT